MAGRGSAPGERRGGRLPGVPNKATAEVRAIAQGYGPDIIQRLADLGGLGAPDAKAESETAQLAADACPLQLSVRIAARKPPA